MSQRRSFGGPRREASERVVIREAGASKQDPSKQAATEEAALADADAWTLNVSRGGCRLVVEVPVTVGTDYDVQIGDGDFRPARVVWVRDEADGQIAGLQFLDVEGGEVPASIFPSE